jgi:hypothetical protein
MRLLAIIVAAIAVTTAIPGCTKSEDRPALHSVRGFVYYNKSPATGAQVMLHPLPLKKGDWHARRPAGRVERDGSFQITTYTLHDGVPAGEYALTVVWSGEEVSPGPDLLGYRYRDAAHPLSKVIVRDADVQLEPFQLKGDPINPAAAKAHP